jgi:hypothetical protein
MFVDWGTWEEELAKHEAIEQDLLLPSTPPEPNPPDEAVYVGNAYVWMRRDCEGVKSEAKGQGARPMN